MRFCPIPFENLEIDSVGNVYTCCPSYLKDYPVGNINYNSLTDIWNNEAIQILRQSVLDGSYEFCSREYCQYINGGNFVTSKLDLKDYQKVMSKYPIVVKLSYDKECNIACRICRDDVIKNSDEEFLELDKKFETLILPALKDTQVVCVNAHGDPFGSRHTRKVIKKIMDTYPSIHFDFQTNGTLCDRNLLDKLCITDKIDYMRISVSATTAETYGRMVKNGDKLFDKLKSNLQMLSELKKEHNFEYYLHFIVTSKNYEEMADFIGFAEKYNAIPCFWEFTYKCVSYAKNLDDSWIITNPAHEEYDLFKAILKDKRFDRYRTKISPLIWKIREDALHR